MNLPDYDSPAELKLFLEQRNLGMQKKFGQNFLVNPVAREKLVLALDVQPNMEVWEVGPGLGSMTSGLLKADCSVTAFEIDRGFVCALKEIFGDEKKFHLCEGDVLKTWKKQLATAEASNKCPQRFFGNLPYNISATLIANFIEADFRFEKCVVTVQKEVAQRMVAKPNTKDYSSFSVLCQWAYDVKTLQDLAAGSFWPVPHVASRAVTMIKKADFPRCKNPKLFMAVERALFMSRRKTVKNNLDLFFNEYLDWFSKDNDALCKTSISDFSKEILLKSKIKESDRAEVLSIDKLLELSDVLNEYFIVK